MACISLKLYIDPSGDNAITAVDIWRWIGKGDGRQKNLEGHVLIVGEME